MREGSVPQFDARHLELEMLDPNSAHLVRLFRHAGGDWEPPATTFRNLRVDPPDGHKSEFAVLYTGNSIAAVAMECRVLFADLRDRYMWVTDLAAQYQVVRYSFGRPAIFVPLDGRNRRTLGLDGNKWPLGTYEPYQRVSLALFQRFGAAIHGLSWESFHRNQLGRVYAIWHDRKGAIELKISSPKPYPSLADDPDWKAFLSRNPTLQPLGAATDD
ncbi:MAG TPA: RES domain-containing protein [Trinickia sp.]|jgi:hypothetical protein|uniref:RES domain-containing protein n=1 Tax=Trinickia sp. TaxID=2571163 RepID=UPI002CE2A363|nr:RES domain-containing protein [Trinickia sp.]HTI18497.1 RES domain-containing protein [Trinickia sp.]